MPCGCHAYAFGECAAEQHGDGTVRKRRGDRAVDRRDVEQLAQEARLKRRSLGQTCSRHVLSPTNAGRGTRRVAARVVVPRPLSHKPHNKKQRAMRPRAGIAGRPLYATAAARVAPWLLVASLSPPPKLAPSLRAIDATALPAHLAVVMDGNSRWAEAQGVPVASGHAQGVHALRELIGQCLALGSPLRVLTVYAFSTENWGRPQAEVDALLLLIQSTLEAEAAELRARGVRLRFIGERDRLPERLRALLDELEAAPPDEERLLLCVALNYGGQQAIAAAAGALAARAVAGELAPCDITPAHVAAALRDGASGPPCPPDVVLRTGGQQRLSNFLLFEVAYAELVTLDALWPAFDAAALADGLEEYARRRRTLGVRHETS